MSEGVIEQDGAERYALTISTQLTSANPIETQIRHVNEAMLRWIRARGSECGRVIISVAAEQPQEQHITSWIIRLKNQNILERQLLEKLPIELLLCNTSGKILNRLNIGEVTY